ncbi:MULTISPECIES: hypothetical protein [Clostridium]|jgi:hypothetical protein|uniref:Uncharacterized protein n=1 Tax=Clostridium intestinale TaxID=36845 RepID=A0A7D6VVQ7_9CLOT|nr:MULTISPECIES: hypothetical protein [Clostridium]QLY81130.1 hypothetical protein HZF06_05960 [Clostridium intestinale]WRY51898.1 hypothetical protein P8F83_01615 [Clostridium intestinale]
MIRIEKPSLLKNTPEYEDAGDNVVVLSAKEREELGYDRGCCANGNPCCKDKK